MVIPPVYWHPHGGNYERVARAQQLAARPSWAAEQQTQQPNTQRAEKRNQSLGQIRALDGGGQLTVPSKLDLSREGRLVGNIRENKRQRGFMTKPPTD